MRYITFMWLVIIMTCCKEQPNYNPFDNQFDVSVRALVKDNCDTMSAGCRYYNLTKRGEALRPYYQIYADEYGQVVAKGFIYSIDTFAITHFRDIYTDSLRLDSIANLPIDLTSLNKEFSQFGFMISDRQNKLIQIVNPALKDTVQLELSTFPINRNQHIERGIGYFRTFEDH